MSTWLFDLGNTRLKFAPLDADGGIGTIRVAAHDGATLAEGWSADLPATIDTACIASVAAPVLTTALLDALTTRARLLSIARTQAVFAGMRIAYREPQRLGVDRFLALLAAHARAPQPALVVGVGTALTIDLLDDDGCHLGGRIAASPTLMREALHARAPQLPAAGGDYVEFASDTEAGLASGCLGAALGLVEHSLRAARAHVLSPPRLLLHGGGAQALLPQLPTAQHAPALVLEGLACWARA